MKFTSTLTVALLSAFALSAIPACGDKKADEKKADEKKPEPAPEEKKEEATAEAPAGGGDKIGVPECDELVEKYAKCVNMLPETARAGQQAGMNAMVKSFKDMAAGPGKEQLAAACKIASDTTKHSMTALGCAW